jgi:hypothetical protein
MRDIEIIDSYLRLLAAVRRTARELTGRMPSTALIDDLLDERGRVRGWTLTATKQRPRSRGNVSPAPREATSQFNVHCAARVTLELCGAALSGVQHQWTS